MTNDSRLLTVREVADRLAVSPRFVRRLIFEKRIPYTKFGEHRSAHVRIAEADVDAYLEANRIEAGEQAS